MSHPIPEQGYGMERLQGSEGGGGVGAAQSRWWETKCRELAFIVYLLYALKSTWLSFHTYARRACYLLGSQVRSEKVT